jgi:hypothetical protein
MPTELNPPVIAIAELIYGNTIETPHVVAQKILVQIILL